MDISNKNKEAIMKGLTNAKAIAMKKLVNATATATKNDVNGKGQAPKVLIVISDSSEEARKDGKSYSKSWTIAKTSNEHNRNSKQ